jgi:hypothetical protein
MKTEVVGWVPADESSEETLSWMDPHVMHNNKPDAVFQWGDKVKKIRVTVIIEEMVDDHPIVATSQNPPAADHAAPPQQSADRKKKHRHHGRHRSFGKNVRRPVKVPSPQKEIGNV